MTYPTTHKLTTVHLDCYSPSVGSSPVAAYLRVPFRCQILKLTSVLYGAITTADCSVATAVTGTAIPGGTIPIPQSGSAAGQVNSAIPSASTFANEDDTISFTPSLASGANVACTFSAVLKQV